MYWVGKVLHTVNSNMVRFSLKILFENRVLELWYQYTPLGIFSRVFFFDDGYIRYLNIHNSYDRLFHICEADTSFGKLGKFGKFGNHSTSDTASPERPYVNLTWLNCDYFIWCILNVFVLTCFVKCVWVCVCVGFVMWECVFVWVL